MTTLKTNELVQLAQLQYWWMHGPNHEKGEPFQVQTMKPLFDS
jgi:hypothetical protein